MLGSAPVQPEVRLQFAREAARQPQAVLLQSHPQTLALPAWVVRSAWAAEHRLTALLAQFQSQLVQRLEVPAETSISHQVQVHLAMAELLLSLAVHQARTTPRVATLFSRLVLALQRLAALAALFKQVAVLAPQLLEVRWVFHPVSEPQRAAARWPSCLAILEATVSAALCQFRLVLRRLARLVPSPCPLVTLHQEAAVQFRSPVAVATLVLAVTSISRLVQRPHQQTLAVFFRWAVVILPLPQMLLVAQSLSLVEPVALALAVQFRSQVALVPQLRAALWHWRVQTPEQLAWVELSTWRAVQARAASPVLFLWARARVLVVLVATLLLLLVAVTPVLVALFRLPLGSAAPPLVVPSLSRVALDHQPRAVRYQLAHLQQQVQVAWVASFHLQAEPRRLAALVHSPSQAELQSVATAAASLSRQVSETLATVDQSVLLAARRALTRALVVKSHSLVVLEPAQLVALVALLKWLVVLDLAQLAVHFPSLLEVEAQLRLEALQLPQLLLALPVSAERSALNQVPQRLVLLEASPCAQALALVAAPEVSTSLSAPATSALAEAFPWAVAQHLLTILRADQRR
jgi:hypothetical protein